MTSPTGTGFRLEGVSVRLGGQLALDRIDLRVEPGERVGLVGPSGAGKTTLLRLLNGAQRPTTGRVVVGDPHLGDTDLGVCGEAELRHLRARVGTIHQDLRLVPNVRVLRNVLMGRLGHQTLLRSLAWWLRPPRAELRCVYGLLERVGIGDKLYQRTDRLSGGEQQRVALARALYQEPRLILADEPIASLDPARAREVLELLVGLCRDGDITLCTSLHDLAAARSTLTRLVGLRRGRVVFDRPVDDLTDDDFQRLYTLDPGGGDGDP